MKMLMKKRALIQMIYFCLKFPLAYVKCASTCILFAIAACLPVQRGRLLPLQRQVTLCPQFSRWACMLVGVSFYTFIGGISHLFQVYFFNKDEVGKLLPHVLSFKHFWIFGQNKLFERLLTPECMVLISVFL